MDAHFRPWVWALFSQDWSLEIYKPWHGVVQREFRLKLSKHSGLLCCVHPLYCLLTTKASRMELGNKICFPSKSTESKQSHEYKTFSNNKYLLSPAYMTTCGVYVHSLVCGQFGSYILGLILETLLCDGYLGHLVPVWLVQRSVISHNHCFIAPCLISYTQN